MSGLVRLAGRQDLFVVVRRLAPLHESQIINPEKTPALLQLSHKNIFDLKSF